MGGPHGPHGPHGPGGPYAAFSADTEDLNTFAERGHRFIVALESLQAQVGAARQLVDASIGSGHGPQDSATGALQELVAEVAINNAFVADLSRSLTDPTAQSTVASVSRSTGIMIEGGDRPLGDDLALLTMLRSRPLEHAGVPPDAVDRLAATAESQRAAVMLLASGATPDSLRDASLAQIITVATFAAGQHGHDIEGDHLVALLTGGYGPALRRAILEGEVAPPNNETRDLVVDAMVAGLGPQDVGLAAVYFPAAYRGDRALRDKIAAAEEDREEADGHSWSWFDHDPDELAEADDALNRLTERRDAYVADRMMAADGTVGYWDALAATSDYTAGSSWEGLTYGFHFNGFHETKITDSEMLKQPDGFSVELRHMGDRLAKDPVAATAFFNRISVDRTADLATFLAGNDLGQDTFDAFGHALAGASQAVSADGSPGLAFSGAALLSHPKRRTSVGVMWHSPALLFTAGSFDSAFLADATEAALQLAEEGEQHGRFSVLGSSMLITIRREGKAGSHTTFREGGEDPRNVLLARAAEDPVAIDRLLGSMIGPAGPSQGWPPPGSLDPLLKPHVPFGPVGPREGGSLFHVLIPSVTVADVGPRGHDIAYPRLSSNYPIIDVLESLRTNNGHTAAVLRYVADTVSADGPMLKDPGTVFGIDLLLAEHATLMLRGQDLLAAGIERTTLNDGARYPVNRSQWQTVYREVLRLGRGQAVAVAADRLLGQAIAAAVDATGWFHSDVVVPFAALAGRVTRDATDGLITYSASLDDAHRELNRLVNLAMTLSLSLVSLVPLAGPVISSAGGAGWAWFFDGYPTDQELRARIAVAEVSEWQTGLTWEDRVATQHLQALTDPTGRGVQGGRGELEMMLPSTQTGGGDGSAGGAQREPVTVSLQGFRERGGAVTYRWEHPDTGQWNKVPLPSDSTFEERFGPTGFDATTPTWLAVAESRDLIDDYRGLGDDTAWIDEWLGSGGRGPGG